MRDSVTISSAAKNTLMSSQTVSGSFVAKTMEAWHRKYFEEKNLSPDQNSEAWLPENREW
jgi:hypothetical protein